MGQSIIHYVLDFIMFVICLISILRGTGDGSDYWIIYSLMFSAAVDVYLCVRKHQTDKANKKNAESEMRLSPQPSTFLS